MTAPLTRRRDRLYRIVVDQWPDGVTLPERRRYLSLPAAQYRAGLLNRYGATVHVEASAPIDWTEPITLPVPDLPPEPVTDPQSTFPPLPDGNPF